MEAGQGSKESFAVSGNASKASGAGKASFHYRAAGQQNETGFGFSVLDNCQLNARHRRCIFGRLCGVFPIDIGQLHMISGGPLHLSGQAPELVPILFAGGDRMQCKQESQHTDRRMHLRLLAPLGTVVSGSRTRRRRKFQGARDDDERCPLALAPRKLTQLRAQIFHQDFAPFSLNPALRLLIHNQPWRQIVRDYPPLVAGPHDVSQSVKYRSQRAFPPRRVLPAQILLLIAYIVGIPNYSLLLHRSMLREYDFTAAWRSTVGIKLITVFSSSAECTTTYFSAERTEFQRRNEIAPPHDRSGNHVCRLIIRGLLSWRNSLRIQINA